MSGQEHTTQEGAERRKIAKALLAAPPILAVITSQPVQAVQGLSNMLSGNVSSCRGDNRYGGQSPGFWKTPSGSTDAPGGHRWDMAWNMAIGVNNLDDSYGEKTKLKPKKWEDFDGGITFGAAGFSDAGIDSSLSLREVLNLFPGSDHFHYIAGFLNASYFEAIASGPPETTEYFMTVDQFWDLYHGVEVVPDAYASLKDLIESNYHQIPGSDCP
jgi:hypothetical protein